MVVIPSVIRSFQHATNRSEVGGKASTLARLRTGDILIPPWFVITPVAFEMSLSPDQQQQLRQPELSLENIVQIATQAMIHPEIIEQINTAIKTHRWGVDTILAVRSSAIDEDGENHSFAGQLESILGVSPSGVIEAIQNVWQSGFTDRVITYRQHHGLSPVPSAPAVIVQEMIVADVAGVAFAADPISGKRSVAVISSVWGLGTSLVSGEVDGDTFYVDLKGKIQNKLLGHKHLAHRLDFATKAVKVITLSPETANQLSLGDDQVQAIANLVRKTSKFFGRPQDIEWAIKEDQLFLLQSRPITALPPDPEGIPNLWDNANISESYSGITTPLTFSFARRAYEEVYRQFCLILGVSPSVIADQGNVFRHMIGLVRGRVYYNLFNWYRALALLPGFSSNQKFMEQMMGVREGLPPEIVKEIADSLKTNLWQDRWRLILTIIGLIKSYFTLDQTIDRFYKRLTDALKPTNLEQMQSDRLVAEYRLLEQKLLTRWDAPLINDFLAMIFFGLLGKLTKQWCNDRDQTLCNQLLCGEGGIISTEPARRITDMGKLVARTPEFVQILCNQDITTIQAILPQYIELQDQIKFYLEQFGDRCLEELKLESSTLVDDPLPLYRSIGSAGLRSVTSQSVNSSLEIRSQAENQVRFYVSRNLIKGWIFNWVLGNARTRVKNRENLRFERTRLFGRVRRIFVELGRRYWDEEILSEPGDIFYLDVEDALGFVEGSSTCGDLRSLANLRKTQFKEFQELEPPPERFQTRGTVYLSLFHSNSIPSQEKLDSTILQGLGCCPGRVQGKICVIRDPRSSFLTQGDILVAERTDPGWILLFPAASGILVQRGSLLSHSAIVAREMGIPAIVSIPDLLERLQTGQRVEMDGSTGVIKIIESEKS